MQAPFSRLFDIILYQSEQVPEYEQFYFKVNQQWKSICFKDFVERGNQLSAGLLRQGIQRGDFVALVCTSRYEWHLIDFALSQIGVVCVPLYTSLTAQEYEMILEEAKPKLIFVSNIALWQLIQKACQQKPHIPVYTIDEIPNTQHYSHLYEKNYSLEILEQERAKVKSTDLLTIIYTSGTEGKPKGVMLSHQNIVSNIVAIRKSLRVTNQDIALTFLPLNHIYEKMVTYFFISVACKIYYAESLVKVIDNIKEVRPTIFTSIPLMMKKIYDKIIEKGNKLTGFKKKIFAWSLRIAKQWDSQRQFSFSYRLQRFILDKLVYVKWRQALGGRIRIIASGSAAINPMLIRIFNCANIALLEGYGLTETSPVVSVNLPHQKGMKIGTVGPLLEGVQVKIADDGEILVKGPNVMMGYYLQEQKTKEVLDEQGWFGTGDIGRMAEGDFLKITDRKKELFKTSGGKYVSPQYVEGKVKESILIENLMVMGSNQDVVAALVQPNWEVLKKHCEEQKIPFADPITAITQKEIIQLYRAEIDKANQQLASHENVRRFELVPDTWSIASEELTPTLKLKRRVIAEKYQHLYQKMFSKT